MAIDARLFPYDRQHQTFVNVYEDGALRHQAIIDTRRTSMEYYAGSWPGVGAVLATFVPAGIHHIAIGPDHILFLVGLILLGGSLARLGLIVTSFTIGHSITLSIAALGIYSPPGSIVEPAIALSLVLVGADNLLAGQGLAGDVEAGRRRDLRAPMAALFGLVHGFGFAAVLREFGLPQAAIGWSLFGFNLGVELGQLALVVPAGAGTGGGPASTPPRRPTYGDGRLCRRRAGRGLLVRPARLLPRGHRMKRTLVLSSIVVVAVVAVAGRALLAQQPPPAAPKRRGHREGEGQPLHGHRRRRQHRRVHHRQRRGAGRHQAGRLGPGRSWTR